MDQSWKYSSEQKPAIPVIELRLGGFPLRLTVDTGFGGGILIPLPLFQSLGLLSFQSPDSYFAVMPDSRRVKLYTSRAEVTIDSASSFVVDIHSSAFLEKKIVGRSFLKSFVLMLDGRKGELRIRD